MTEEQANGLLGLAGKLTTSLPAQFLALLLLNLLVVGGLLWIEDRRADAREHVLIKLLDTCGGSHDRG